MIVACATPVRIASILTVAGLVSSVRIVRCVILVTIVSIVCIVSLVAIARIVSIVPICPVKRAGGMRVRAIVPCEICEGTGQVDHEAYRKSWAF
jgi:hypothetical protein